MDVSSFFFAFFFVQTPLLLIQPQFFYFFNLAVLVQIVYYGPQTPSSYFKKQYSALAAWAAFLVGLAVGGAIETGIYFGIRSAYEQDMGAAIQVIGCELEEREMTVDGNLMVF